MKTAAEELKTATGNRESHLLRRQNLAPVAMLAATFVAYVATLGLGFVFDDHILILANDSIRSWHYFPSYFTSHIWAFRYPHLLANYYRPLFLTWLRFNDMLFGLRPRGWHLNSTLLHVAVTGLVYRLSLKLSGDWWVALIAGLLFGLHPVHVEAVADITSVQEPLSTFFILAALLAFARRVEERSPQIWWLALSMALAAAAMLSKESGMVLPVLASVYSCIFGSSSGRETVAVEGPPLDRTRRISALKASIPFWIVLLIYVALRVRALKGFAHVLTPLPLRAEFFTLPSVLVFCLRLLVWPFRLSCYYDTPYSSSPDWRSFILPASLLVSVIGILGLWYAHTRRSSPAAARAIAFASLWMVLTLVPVLNFRYLPNGELSHDRYVYLPSVGFVILAALALRQAIPQPSKWLLAGGLALFGAMGFTTARQCLFWSDDLTLYSRAHAIAPHNVYATTSLAAAAGERGMDSAAMALYRQVLAIQPQFWRANVNLAYLYYAHGNYPDAARYFARATAADPTDGDQFLYMGMSLLRIGELSKAEKAVRMALLVRPQAKTYHLGLAMVLRGERKLTEARREVEAELEVNSQNAQAKGLLGELSRHN